ncbi:MAG TPA: type 1 glutamine amidotransferase [Bdellovibrionales bacterium]|nr:type 1 glutamine amidotransferase [Bdellovibrionales bacterium]
MSALRIHILQPTERTTPGSISEWLKTKNHDVKLTRLFTGDPLPKVDDFDWLIVLGGRMSVWEVEDYPWLIEVKALMLEAVRAHKTGLGICLGSQLLAETLGAKVRRNDHWEIGWHRVQLGAPNSMMAAMTVYEHHQDTFDLPPSTVRIATNEATRNQGFAYGDRVVALQFHPEATSEWIEQGFKQDPYPTGPYVQSPEEINNGMGALSPMRKWFFALLDRLEAASK